MIQYTFEYTSRNNEDIYIAGSFNNWNKIKMYQYGNKYYYHTFLHYGEYEYKFFLNNEWIYNNNLPIIITKDGIINNHLKINNFYNLDDPLSKEYNVTFWQL
jgi:hypothetical protein